MRSRDVQTQHEAASEQELNQDEILVAIAMNATRLRVMNVTLIGQSSTPWLRSTHCSSSSLLYATFAVRLDLSNAQFIIVLYENMSFMLPTF